MANGKKGPKMDKQVVKRLLDGLTTDEGFRKKFQEDAPAALESIGYVAPEDDAAEAAAGNCLQMTSDQSLASAEDITRDREKLESAFSAIFAFTSPLAR